MCIRLRWSLLVIPACRTRACTFGKETKTRRRRTKTLYEKRVIKHFTQLQERERLTAELEDVFCLGHVTIPYRRLTVTALAFGANSASRRRKHCMIWGTSLRTRQIHLRQVANLWLQSSSHR